MAGAGADDAGVRIALFGGSFDPPHWGHVLAAAYAFSAGMVDQVWVMPVDRHAYGKPLSPWAQRWALCEAAFAGIAYVRLRDDERRNPGGYTIDLVGALREADPGNEWFLVGGTDTARDMVNWHRGAELTRMVGVIAVPRRGYDQHPAALPEISSTKVRELCAAGEPIDGLVPPRVAARIRAERWYGAPAG